MSLSRLFLVTLLFLPPFAAKAQEDGIALARRWMVYAQGLASQGRHAEAGPAFEKALQMSPGDAAVLQARGRWHWEQGRREEGLRDLQASLQADPSQANLAAWLARQTGASDSGGPAAQEELLGDAQALLEGREFAPALKLYAQAQPQAAASAAWQRLRAEALYGRGDFDAARAALAEARRLDPLDPELARLEQRYFHAGLASDGGGGRALPPLLRSAVLPGWGQAHNGQKRKAWALGGLCLGLLAGTVATYMAADQALAHYRGLDGSASAADFDAAFSRADGLVLANQALGLAFYAAYIYNLLDAGAHARPAPAAQALGPRVPVLALRFF